MFSPVSSIVLDYTQVLQIHYTITVAKKKYHYYKCVNSKGSMKNHTRLNPFIVKLTIGHRLMRFF